MNKVVLFMGFITFTSYSHGGCNAQIVQTAPDSRYQLTNGGAEVKDKQTGLIWQRCSIGQTYSLLGCTGNIAYYNWGEALQAAKTMGNGWRLPNIKELDSLVEQACSFSINQTMFPNTSIVYWSSTPEARGSGYFVRVVSFGEGGVNFYSYQTSGSNATRLVRSNE